MTIDELREEFEAAYAKEVNQGSSEVSAEDMRECRTEDGYTVMAASAAWWAWQASRATLVIKRPEKCEFAEPDGLYHKGYRQGIRSMVDAIEDAGLKVAP